MIHPVRKRKILRFAPYTLNRRFLNYRIAFILFGSSLLIGTTGFMLLEGYSLTDGFYMSVITISTVGFMEVEPLSHIGRVFTSMYIIVNIGIFAYSISAFTNAIIQGEILFKMHNNLIHNDIKRLSDHIILCGYGRYGRETAQHFLNHNQSFVIIDSNKETIESIRVSPEKLIYLEGDATQDEVLIQAGIQRAATLVTSLNDDAGNIFTVLTARQLNPGIRIISRAHNEKSARKIKLAGADHVIMPEQIGGFYMASLVNKPGAVEFFTFLTNELNSEVTFEDVPYDQVPLPIRQLTLGEINIQKHTGAIIIGYRSADGKYIANPPLDLIISPGSNLILLGNEEQVAALQTYFKSYG